MSLGRGKRCVRAKVAIALIYILSGYISTMSTVAAVKIIHFNVPKFPSLRSSVTLECEFHISSPEEQLYSVKWYREGWKDSKWQEFYSWKPKKIPNAHDTKLDGIKVDMHRSSVSKVVLRKVNLKTSGTFRCEVTTRSDARNTKRFDSETREERLVVVELAKDPPEIRGGLPSYQLGDRLALNCTSQRTYPATTLRWILNGKEIAGTKPITITGRKHGLIRSMIRLNKTIAKEDFRNKKVLKIECVGGIQDVPVLHGKHTKMSNTYEVEAFMLPAEYLKQKVAWKTIPLVNDANAIDCPSRGVTMFGLLLIILARYYILEDGTRRSFG